MESATSNVPRPGGEGLDQRLLWAQFQKATDEAAYRGAFRPETKMVWLETPSNPLLRVTDIERCAAIARVTATANAADDPTPIARGMRERTVIVSPVGSTSNAAKIGASKSPAGAAKPVTSICQSRGYLASQRYSLSLLSQMATALTRPTPTQVSN